MPILVAAGSQVSVYGRSLAGIPGFNPTASRDVCLLWVLCVVRQRSLRRDDPSSRAVLPSVVFFWSTKRFWVELRSTEYYNVLNTERLGESRNNSYIMFV